jgi:DNA helicase II / ATP-dependent DNA helicase PcrA
MTTPTKMIWTDVHNAFFTDVREKRSALVTARAGAGKTSACARATGEVSPRDRTLITAFNKSAKEDLEAKVSKSLHVATSHSVGLKVIKASPEGMKMEVDTDRLHNIVRGLSTTKLTKDDHNAVCDVVSYAKNTLAISKDDLNDIAFDLDPTTKNLSLANVSELAFHALEQCKKPDDRKLDHDDMIWLPNVWDLRTLSYNNIFIDEAQDTNLAQVGLLQRCLAPDGRAFLIGDDKQSIYTWRGAMGNAMENLAIVFGVTKRHLLPTSYRCSKAVILWAQKIVPDILPSPTAQDGKVTECNNYDDAEPGDFILSRANRDLVAAHAKLRKANKPSAILGSKFANILRNVVRKSKADNVLALLSWLDIHKAERIKSISENETDLNDRARRIEEETDRLDSVAAIANGASSIHHVMERIGDAFAPPRGDAIILSTTHQAKGLEADRVWIIADSYAFYRQHFGRRYVYEAGKVVDEECNLAYVATTRAKRELNLVIGTRNIGSK